MDRNVAFSLHVLLCFMNLTLTFVAEAHYEPVRLLTPRSANVIIAVSYI